MDNYDTEIDGTKSLENIVQIVVREEATGAEFQQSSVSFRHGKMTNLATFKNLPAGTRPSKDIVFVQEGSATPAGKQLLWAGVLLVSGSNLAVSAYR